MPFCCQNHSVTMVTNSFFNERTSKEAAVPVMFFWLGTLWFVYRNPVKTGSMAFETSGQGSEQSSLMFENHGQGVIHTCTLLPLPPLVCGVPKSENFLLFTCVHIHTNGGRSLQFTSLMHGGRCFQTQ